ncbi:MAG: hypothetical protein JWQ14_1351, partial [Adhaeribacter sp.]|nr:hypothetical protein [Adhaeribacter sp.]
MMLPGLFCSDVFCILLRLGLLIFYRKFISSTGAVGIAGFQNSRRETWLVGRVGEVLGFE